MLASSPWVASGSLTCHAPHSVAVLAAAPFNSGLLARAEPSPDAHFNYAPVTARVLDLARWSTTTATVIHSSLWTYRNTTSPVIAYVYEVDGRRYKSSRIALGGWIGGTQAAYEFAAAHPEFELAQPPWLFNESGLTQNITHWPGAWLRRR